MWSFLDISVADRRYSVTPSHILVVIEKIIGTVWLVLCRGRSVGSSVLDVWIQISDIGLTIFWITVPCNDCSKLYNWHGRYKGTIWTVGILNLFIPKFLCVVKPQPGLLKADICWQRGFSHKYSERSGEPHNQTESSVPLSIKPLQFLHELLPVATK